MEIKQAFIGATTFPTDKSKFYLEKFYLLVDGSYVKETSRGGLVSITDEEAQEMKDNFLKSKEKK